MACLLAMLGDGDVLVPGHGRPVGPRFARAQQKQLAGVADLIRELHAAGVPARGAAEAGGSRWPLPADWLTRAIQVGYDQLGGKGPH